MKNIYQEIVNRLQKGEDLALATLIKRIGSAPREPGAKYLVRKDGSTLGSIGGGCVEAEVWQEAMRVMEREEGRVLHFNLTSEQLAEGGLICGGNIDVFVEPLKKEFLPIYQEVLKVTQEGSEGVLATVISTGGSSPFYEGLKAFYLKSGEKVGCLLGSEGLDERISKEVERLSRMKRPEVMHLSSSEASFPIQGCEILLEPIFSQPTVYIFGAGHISEQLVPLVKRVHFKVVVIDDREIFANRERFPEADEVIVAEFERALDQITLDSSSYIVIVTRGHLYDGLILERVIKTDAFYIGMIGSKKKIATLYNHLTQKGIPEAHLKRVHAPIGLDIGSETPEEIAVSIVAQLIRERRRKLA